MVTVVVVVEACGGDCESNDHSYTPVSLFMVVVTEVVMLFAAVMFMMMLEVMVI